MKVRLKSTFILRGRRYRRGVHELPDDTVLPNGSEILEGKPKAKQPDSVAKAFEEKKAKEKAAAEERKKAEAAAKEEADAKAKAEADAKKQSNLL